MNIFILSTQHIGRNSKKRCNIGKLTFSYLRYFPFFISLCKSFLKSSLYKKLKNKENLKLCQYGLLDQHIWRPLFLYGKNLSNSKISILLSKQDICGFSNPFCFGLTIYTLMDILTLWQNAIWCSTSITRGWSEKKSWF